MFERRPFVQALLLCCLLSIPYWNSLSNGFVWDDPIQLPKSDAEWPSMKRVFLEPSWLALTDEFEKFPNAIITYRPVLLLSFLVDSKVGSGSPVAYHLTNFLFFLALIFVLYILALSLGSSPPLAAAVIILWGSHPLLTETVSWISGRHDLLMLFFLSTSALCVLKYLKRSDGKRWVFGSLGLVLYLLALGSKEPAIFYPLVIALVLYAKRANFVEKKYEVLGYIGLMVCVQVAYLFFRSSVIASGNLAGTKSHWLQYLAVAPWMYTKYLASFFHIPHLTSNFVQPTPTNFGLVTVWGLLLLHSCLVFWFFWLRRFSWAPLVGASIFYLFLSPALVMVGNTDIYNYRFGFTSYLGLSILLAVAAFGALRSLRPSLRKLIFLGGGILMILNGIRTFERNRDYKNDVVFYASAIRDVPQSGFGYSALGLQLLNANQIAEAEAVLRKGMLADPSYKKMYNNLSVLLMQTGRLDEAQRVIDQGLQKDPYYDKLYFNRGSIYEAQNQLPEAEKAYLKAIELNPSYRLAYRRLFELYSKSNPQKADEFKRQNGDKL